MPFVTATIERSEMLSTPPPWPGATPNNTFAVLLMRKGLQFNPTFNPTAADLCAPWASWTDPVTKTITVTQHQPPKG